MVWRRNRYAGGGIDGGVVCAHHLNDVGMNGNVTQVMQINNWIRYGGGNSPSPPHIHPKNFSCGSGVSIHD